MTEDYLYFLWENRIALPNQFTSTDIGKIQVIDRGVRNHFSGPDFLNARVKIKNTLLVGDIEFHVKSSDWYAHKHHLNSAFDTVILHLVYLNDSDVYIKGKLLPTVFLKPYIKEKHYHVFTQWKKDFSHSIKCQTFLTKNSLNNPFNLKRLLDKRMERKVQSIVNDYIHHKKDLHQTLFSSLGKVLGYPSNSYPMTMISDRVSWKSLQRLGSERAVLSTLLAASELDYNSFSKEVKKEVEYRGKQFSFEKFKIQWNFARLRPSGLPQRRIMEWALLSNYGFHNLIQLIINKSMGELEDWLDEKSEEHYFQNSHVSGLSNFSKQMVMINVLAPYALFLSSLLNRTDLKSFALEIIENQPFEKNYKTKPFMHLVKNKTAATSQALIHHYNSFCQPKKCLHCSIGKQWLLNYD